MTDAEILTAAKEENRQMNAALQQSFEEYCSDRTGPFSHKRIGTAVIVIEGRLVRFADDGEPYFA